MLNESIKRLMPALKGEIEYADMAYGKFVDQYQALGALSCEMIETANEFEKVEERFDLLAQAITAHALGREQVDTLLRASMYLCVESLQIVTVLSRMKRDVVEVSE